MPGHCWLSCAWHAGTGDNLALLSFRKFIMSFKKKEDIGQSSFSWHMLRKNWRVLMIRDYPCHLHGFIPRDGTAHKYRYFGCSFGCTNCSNCVVIYCYLLFARLQLILWRYIRLTTMEQNIVGWEQWRCWDSVPWPNTQQLEHEG